MALARLAYYIITLAGARAQTLLDYYCARRKFQSAHAQAILYGFPVRSEGTCLGYRWRQDLSSLPMIQDRIQGQVESHLILFNSGDMYIAHSPIWSRKLDNVGRIHQNA